jgi:hypothetical protein
MMISFQGTDPDGSGPSTATIAMASRMNGNASCMSATSMISSSTGPEK